MLTRVCAIAVQLLDDSAALESICQWQEGGTGLGEGRLDGGSSTGEVEAATDLLLFYCSKAEVVRTEATRLLENAKNLEARLPPSSAYPPQPEALAARSVSPCVWPPLCSGVDQRDAECETI